MKEFIIKENDANMRVDKFIPKVAPSLPSNLIQKYIRLKRVKVNSARTTAATRLIVGDIVTMYINDEFFEVSRADKAKPKLSASFPDIVYEDDNIILLNKPAGVPVHEDDSKEETLIAQLLSYLASNGKWNPDDEASFIPALCNRIDRNTSGIVIAAKNAESLRIMNDKIKNREISKYYLCAVLGKLSPPNGMVKNFIFKDAKENRVYVHNTSKPGAKTAITKYSTLKHKDGISLVECELITGRTHQIRAHMAFLGHPLVGDGKYGKNVENKKYGMKHQALCSYKLVFKFTSPSGCLEYLNGKTFVINDIPFKKKLF